MAATRLIALHITKGGTVAQCLRDRTDYAQNPEKTEKGNLVTGYECDPMTVDEEFLLSKRQYQHITGKEQKHDVIAYQIRQSFKPGEITAEKANEVGYELALRFTKGKHAFIVATHTDRAHIHNHIIFNSTTLDCKRKFHNFFFSGLAIQKVSDLVCLENGLSIIEKKPYDERKKRTDYPQRTSHRDELCKVIDSILKNKPDSFSDFLRQLESEGYEIKQGKHISVRGKNQAKYIRFRSLGDGYSEEEIRAVINGSKIHRSKFQNKNLSKGNRLNLLIDLDNMMTAGNQNPRSAKIKNIKRMAETVLFIRNHGIESLDQLREKTAVVSAHYDEIDTKLKADEKRLVEIAALKTHIINYVKTRDVYVQYRKSGYSKRFFEEHREAITLHKAAKDAFDKMGLEKLPKVKDLSAEYSTVLEEKKKLYAEYRTTRAEMQEYQIAKRNVEMFYELQEQEEKQQNNRENVR